MKSQVLNNFQWPELTVVAFIIFFVFSLGSNEKFGFVLWARKKSSIESSEIASSVSEL